MTSGLSAGQVRWGRYAGLLAALAFTVPGVLHPERWVFLNNVNLVFHEAGHVLLMFFGETVTLLGGSLFQVLIPAGIALAFWWRGERYAAGLVALWAAQSLANVSAYIRDAPTRQLDLITGDPDTHDWWQLLGGWNSVHNHLGWAAPLANVVLAAALVTLVLGAVLAVWDDFRE